MKPRVIMLLTILAWILAGCQQRSTGVYQGYVEQDFVHVSSTQSGYLESLAVEEGDRVEKGEALFSLEALPEETRVEEMKKRIAAARKRLEEMQLGEREEAIQAQQAALEARQAEARLRRLQFERQQKLKRGDVVAREEFDRAKSEYEQAQAWVREAQKRLELANLGAREQLVQAQREEIAALETQLREARWRFAQASRQAPAGGIIDRVLFEPGELVQAAQPVVVISPDHEMKVRFFVPEAELNHIQNNQKVRVQLTDAAPELEARISYISTDPEYTPPVIFSEESRDKLVWRVEARFGEGAEEVTIHPGQPATVLLPGAAIPEKGFWPW